MLAFSWPFKQACAAFMEAITALRAHFLTFALPRARSRDASNLRRARFEHDARDKLNADKLDDTKLARPKVMQDPGFWSDAETEVIACTFLQDIN